MDTHATWMKPQLQRELMGTSWAGEGRQVCEQSRARRLGQHVTRTVGPTDWHGQKLLIAGFGKVRVVFS